MRSFVLMLLVSLAVVNFAGCGGNSPSTNNGNNGNGSNVLVSVLPSTATQLGASGTQQFSATVTGSSNTAVTWSVSGGGTINSSGLYTAPSKIPSQTTATVTATSQADTTKSANGTVQLMPISVTVSPVGATLDGFNGTQQFAAQVSWGQGQAVTWTLSGPGQVEETGNYTAPATVPSQTSATVSATSVQDTTKSGSATVTLTPPTLNGQYAFIFQGDDGGGMMRQEAGTFIADGKGDITGGVEDIVSMKSGANTNVTFTGSYAADNAGDGRGTITIHNSLGVSRTFGFALGPALARVRFIETADGTGSRGTGVMEQQDTTAFPIAKTKGAYAFGFSGADSGGGNTAVVGSFQLDGVGTINSGTFDIDAGGNTTAGASFTGTYAADSTTPGRFTATFNGQAPYASVNLAFYVVSASEAFWVTLDPVATNPISAGRALSQTGGPFSNSSLNTAANVFYIAGAGETDGSAGSIVDAGIMVTDGNGNITGGQADENFNGDFTEYEYTNSTYSVTSSASGRGTMTLNLDPTDPAGGNVNTHFLTFYLVSPNTAFMLDNTIAADHVPANYAGLGFTQSQTVGPSSSATFSGPYYEGSWSPATSLTPVEATATTSGGNLNFTGTGDFNLSASTYSPDVAFNGTYSLQAQGRGTMQRSGGASTEDFIFYMITKNEAVAFTSDTTQTNPVIEFFQNQ